MFLFLPFHFHSFFPFSLVTLFHLLYYLFSLFLGDDTKWPTRVDLSLNNNTINLPNLHGNIRGHKEWIRFWWQPNFQGHSSRKTANSVIFYCLRKSFELVVGFLPNLHGCIIGWPWPNFQGHSSRKTVKLQILWHFLCLLKIVWTSGWILTKFAWNWLDLVILTQCARSQQKKNWKLQHFLVCPISFEPLNWFLPNFREYVIGT